MSKNIVVTGGAGFLGSHLCEWLLADGHHVLCIDNFHTGREENIRHLLKNPNFKLKNADIEHQFFADMDQLYHLACPASPMTYQLDPVKTMRLAVIGSLNALEAALQSNARILLASTSEVYGDPEVHPQTEQYCGRVNPISKRACYNEGKRSAETLFSDYRRQYNLNTKLARIFNTYGPRMAVDDGRVVSNFIVQALMGKNITVFGNGSQTRSLCFVNDLIDGLVKTMSSDIDFSGPVNLGSSHEIEIGELAETILILCKSQSRIVYKRMRDDEPKRRCPDVTLAQKKLHWKSTISLADGLHETVEYFRGVLK